MFGWFPRRTLVNQWRPLSAVETFLADIGWQFFKVRLADIFWRCPLRTIKPGEWPRRTLTPDYGSQHESISTFYNNQGIIQTIFAKSAFDFCWIQGPRSRETGVGFEAAPMNYFKVSLLNNERMTPMGRRAINQVFGSLRVFLSSKSGNQLKNQRSNVNKTQRDV